MREKLALKLENYDILSLEKGCRNCIVMNKGALTLRLFKIGHYSDHLTQAPIFP